MRIAKPTAAKPRGAIGHDFQLIHGRAAAQFEQQVKIILGDIGGHLIIRTIGPPAEIRGLFDLRLNDIPLPFVEGIAEYLEPIAVIGFKQGHAEIGDWVIAQIAGKETDAPFARHMQCGGGGQRLDALLHAAAPIAVPFHHADAFFQAMHLAQFVMHGRMPPFGLP